MRSKGEQGSACFAGDRYEALQSMLKGEYTEESTGARTIRQSGGKDRHSKVFTSRGPRDRRVRLSVATAIRFYDLQDRLGFEQPSKAVEWLLVHCQPSIKALPQLKSLHPHVHIAALPAQPAHNVSDYAPSDTPTMDGLTCPHDYIAHHSNITLNHHDQYREHRDQHVHFRNGCQARNQPLYAAGHKQDSLVEDPPESSNNPSSSGGSSDHPTSLSTVSQHDSFEITNYTQKAMTMFPYHSTSLGISRQHDQSYSTSSSFLCPSKRRRMQSPSACFPINHMHLHVAPENCSTFTANMNAAGKGAYRLEAADHEYSERLMRANNIVTAYSDCSVDISTNTAGVLMYETPLPNTSQISNNVINTSTSSIPKSSLLNMVQDNSQPMVRLPSSCAEQSQYIGFMHSQRLGAEIVSDGTANETLMCFQDVVGDDSLSTLSENVNDTVALQLYGEMREMAATATAYRNNSMEVSPSESNSMNNSIAAAYLYWQRR